MEQESEEYLKAALDSSKISMTKVEYDTLVDTERQLRQELENLKCEKQDLECEKQELELQCASLRHQATTQSVYTTFTLGACCLSAIFFYCNVVVACYPGIYVFLVIRYTYL